MHTVTETEERFACFGTHVVLRAGDADPRTDQLLEQARAFALEAHDRLTRFELDSELSRLNADPREAVPAHPLLRRLARAVHAAGAATGGLVDATCLPAVEAAGYTGHLDPERPEPRFHRMGPAAPLPGHWRAVRVEGEHVVRPAGVRLDSGGLAKGLVADRIAARLGRCETFVVACGGDLRLGGRANIARAVEIRDPFDPERVLHAFALADGAVATSGVTRRRWSGGHHLIDPRTGRPADTGIVQVTALAPSGLAAEVHAKAALLAGPARAAEHLPCGGAFVTDDGELHLVEVRS